MLVSVRLLPVLALLTCAPAQAQNCANTSVGFTPLNDLGSGTYQGAQGGLYPGGANTRPAAHEAAGLARAAQVLPRDASGAVDLQNGAIGMMSIGLSNTVAKWNQFMGLASGDPDVNPRLVLVQGAQGGQAAEDVAPISAPYWNGVQNRVQQAGLTNAQMQVIWFHTANRQPMGSFPAQPQALQANMHDIVRNVRQIFPNVRLAYIASRNYAGYATSALNPEPHAYESGFSIKWLIEDQVNGNPALNSDPNQGPVFAPWLSWGTYNWADGLTPRSDGLVWECSDLAADGTHPSPQGALKTAQIVLDFMKSDATTAGWFLGTAPTDPGTPFCFGVGCPCGNDDPTAGCASSTGAGALLTGSGTTSATADDLVLTATGCAPGNSGLFFGASAPLVPPVFVGDGLGCVGGLAFRYFPGVVDSNGVFVKTHLVSTAPGPFIDPGVTRHFQAWTRDVLCGPPPAPCASPCAQNNNLSNAYTVTFGP